jgi:hypothetical protein
MRNSLSIFSALIAGILVALLAGVVAEMTIGAQGHRIRFEELPAEAQAVAKEQGLTPISPEQWKRIDEVMERNGGWPNGNDLTQILIRKASPFFVILPLIVLLLLRWRGISINLRTSVALLAPCAAVLSWAWLAQLNSLLVP